MKGYKEEALRRRGILQHNMSTELHRLLCHSISAQTVDRSRGRFPLWRLCGTLRFFWVWVLTVYRCCLGCSLWSRIYIEWDLSNNTFSGNANSRHLRRRASVSSWDSGTQPCFSVWSVVWSSDRETQFLSNTSFVFFDTVINFSRLQLPLIKIGSVCILWKPLEICILSQVAPDDISQLKFSGLYDFEN